MHGSGGPPHEAMEATQVLSVIQHRVRAAGGTTAATLKEDTFVDTNKDACVNASRELFSVLARYTSSANNCEECDGI